MNSTLDKLWNFAGHGVCSFRTLINKNTFVKSEIASVPSVRYNRVKFNRMNYREQMEYETKMAKMKTEYRLYYDDSVFTEVTKEVYQYFNEYKQTFAPAEYCTEDELKHLFKLP